nr:HD-GYP domain-containing protein [Chloroflexota bacterium]
VTNLTRSHIYTVLLGIAAAAALLAAPRYGVGWTPSSALIALILLALIVLAEQLDISIPRTNGIFDISVGAPLALAAGLALGPVPGTLIVVVAHLVDSILSRRVLLKSSVNIFDLGLSTLLSAWLYWSFADPAHSALGTARNLLLLIIAGVIFTLVNTTALVIVVAPLVGQSTIAMWRGSFRAIFIEILTMPLLGGLVAILAREHPMAILLIAVPLVGPHLAFRALHKVQQQTQATIESLANVLEQRDVYTHEHSVRVTNYTLLMLDEMTELPAETKETILAAARIHDLGKVGTRDVALQKTGPLSFEERQEMQRHAAIGADLLSQIEVYRQCAEIVRNHHERWDGHGYPDGLAAERIPLGSRIIAIADSFDAMTSDRVYRAAMTSDQAIAELSRGRGTQFDPTLVDSFVRAVGRTAPAPAKHLMTVASR